MTLLNKIPSRLRGRLSNSQLETDPHEWKLPSSYSVSRVNGNQTQIPSSKIFKNAFIPTDPTLGTAGTGLIYPDTSHAAVHLALLECFRNLRLSASQLDIDLEMPPTYTEKGEPVVHHGPIKIPPSERWDLLIRLAITRFVAWWMSIDQVFHHANAYVNYGGDKSVVQLTKDYLPPLDVLLVWYVFMIDQDEYASACNDRDMPKLLKLCFPWPAIRDALCFDDMTFKLPRAAGNLFSTLSSQSADIFEYLNAPPAYTPATGLPLQTRLFEEVKKHEAFFDIAHDLLWIRSPSLRGSLERGCVDYLEFQLNNTSFEIETAVGFGVDLIWRTHRLYPIQYQLFREGTTEVTPQLDTKQPVLEETTANLSDDEPEHFAAECCCWTCERIRDDMPGFTYDKTASGESAYDLLLLADLTSEQVRSIQDDLGFYRAVEDARSQGLPLPTRPKTAAEKAAEKIESQKRKEAGVLPNFDEYIVTLPNGKKKVKRVKYGRAFYGTSMAT